MKIRFDTFVKGKADIDLLTLYSNPRKTSLCLEGLHRDSKIVHNLYFCQISMHVTHIPHSTEHRQTHIYP